MHTLMKCWYLLSHLLPNFVQAMEADTNNPGHCTGMHGCRQLRNRHSMSDQVGWRWLDSWISTVATSAI